MLGPTGQYQFPQQIHLSHTPSIMYFQKLKWIIEEALAAHRPISYSALFFETALSALIGINLRKSSSPSVGAREVRRGGRSRCLRSNSFCSSPRNRRRLRTPPPY